MVSSEAQRLLWDALKDKLPEWRVPEVVRELPLRTSDQLTENERSLAVDLASRFVAGNLVPNRDTTTRLRKEAEEAVAPVQVTVEKGETVLREGQVVTAADIEKLDLLGLRNPTTDWRQVGAAAAFAILTMSMLGAYIGAFLPNLATRDRGLGLIALLVIVTVLAAKVVLPTRPLLIYAFPLPAVAMLIATLIDGRLAIVVGALLGVLVGFVTGSSFEAATLALVSGVVAAGAVWRRERLQVYFVAGLLVALAQMAVVVAFQLAQRGEDVQTAADDRGVLHRQRPGLGDAGGRRDLRPRPDLRHHHHDAAPGACQPDPAAPAPAADGGAGHLPPQHHGRQPRRARGRRGRRGSAAGARRRLLPRHRQAEAAVLLRRESGRRRERPRDAGARGQRRHRAGPRPRRRRAVRAVRRAAGRSRA